jgi:hypothetical protein
MKAVFLLLAATMMLFSGCFFCQAAEYGVTGPPEVKLVSPACNSTVTQQPSFAFEPKPDPLRYHHYYLKIRKGESWEVPNYLEKEGIIATEVAFSELSSEPLEPGVYQYNIIAHDASHQSQAGSGPCRFTVSG